MGLPALVGASVGGSPERPVLTIDVGLAIAMWVAVIDGGRVRYEVEVVRCDGAEAGGATLS